MPAPDTGPVPSRIAIVGLGLIGGSIAAGLREAWPRVRRVGVDVDPAVPTSALSSGLVEEMRPDIGALDDCDLIVLATPVAATLAILRRGDWPDRAIVTDVASVKRSIMAAAGGRPRFVGGHPMAGSERHGVAAARADLFEGRAWILTRSAATDDDAVARVRALAVALGARPVEMDAHAHDRVVALVSHLPQIVSVALLQAVADAAGDDGLALAGRGLRDMTRLAESPGGLWREILADNHDEVARALDALAAALRDAADRLTDPEAMSALFTAANARRRALIDQGDPSEPVRTGEEERTR